jgi:hypothetical protein
MSQKVFTLVICKHFTRCLKNDTLFFKIFLSDCLSIFETHSKVPQKYASITYVEEN